jgi:hypothetical protein
MEAITVTRDGLADLSSPQAPRVKLSQLCCDVADVFRSEKDRVGNDDELEPKSRKTEPVPSDQRR